MIKKIFLALISGLVSFFGIVFAQTTWNTEATLSLTANNLPITFSGELNLDLITKNSSFSWLENLSLSFSNCGDDVEVWHANKKKTSSILNFSLLPNEEKLISLTIRVKSIKACQLNFSILNQGKTEAQTSVMLKSLCYQAIDFDQEDILSWYFLEKEQHILDQQDIVNQTHNKNTLSPELKWAFDRALQHGFLSEQEKTLFDKPMTRLQFAHMLLSVSNKLGIEIDEKKTCDFKDINWLSNADIATMKKVCQLNIMGIHPNQTVLTNFMPKQFINRAQMVTVISRMIWGKTFNEWGKFFYTQHLKKAHKEVLINKILPKSLEIRAYFYVILQRADQKGLIKRSD